MSKRVALLRAINVGGTGKVKMADLRQMFADEGFGDVETILQTGNVVFEAPSGEPAELEAQLEEAAAARLGLKSDFIIRTPDEWKSVLADNPFAAFAADNPSSMVVAFAKSAPDQSATAALEEAVDGLPEQIRIIARELFITYPDGQGRSKLDLAKVERKHPVIRATARNWNTVRKVAACLGID